MRIKIEELPYASIRFFKGEFVDSQEITKTFEIAYDVNTAEGRKKVNFYPHGFKYTNDERELILKQFSAGTSGRDICMDGEHLIEE